MRSRKTHDAAQRGTRFGGESDGKANLAVVVYDRTPLLGWQKLSGFFAEKKGTIRPSKAGGRPHAPEPIMDARRIAHIKRRSAVAVSSNSVERRSFGGL